MRFREASTTAGLPAAVTRSSGLTRATKHDDLDDSISDRLDSAHARPLADYLRLRVHRLVTRRPPAPILAKPVLAFPWPRGVDPATVPFATRTVHVLDRMGVRTDRRRLAQLTDLDLLTADYSGPATLLDFGTAVEAQAMGTVDGVLAQRSEVTKKVTQLRRRFPMGKIPCDDPRLDVGLRGATIAAALDGKGPAGSLTVRELAAAVQDVRGALSRIAGQEPREALLEMAGAILRSAPLRSRGGLGWNGGGGCTLADAGGMAGVSPQRNGQLSERGERPRSVPPR